MLTRMNIALTKPFEELIARMVSSGTIRQLERSCSRAALRAPPDAEEKSARVGIVSTRIAAPSLHPD